MAEALTADDVIRDLNLAPLPGEGGYYRETFRSSLGVTIEGTETGVRAASTAIYYFLRAGDYSALHRLKHDEVYHFYRGDPILVSLYDESNGTVKNVLLGSRFERGETCQLVVPRGIWQGSRLAEGGSWGLVGTTVAPAFEFRDCELADRAWFARQGAVVEPLRSLLASPG